MKVIYTKHFPPGRYVAINLLGVVFAKRRLSERAFRHELIHTAQMRELWYVGFYVWYVVEFLVRLVMAWNWVRAYRSVSFEREAYTYDHNPYYRFLRKRFAWWRFLW